MFRADAVRILFQDFSQNLAAHLTGILERADFFFQIHPVSMGLRLQIQIEILSFSLHRRTEQHAGKQRFLFPAVPVEKAHSLRHLKENLILQIRVQHCRDRERPMPVRQFFDPDPVHMENLCK